MKYACPAASGPGESQHPEPALVLEGAPEFTSWPALDGEVQSGVWAATPGLHRVIRDGSVREQFYILEGEIELAEDGGSSPRRFRAGDLVELGPDFRGTWRTITPVRKVYFLVKA